MTSTQLKIISEWVGLRGRIGAWYLNSPFRRFSEILFLGDLRTKYLQQIDGLLRSNGTVLDVGAGSGYFSFSIARRLEQGKVVCLDLSSVMLEELVRRARKLGLSSRIEVQLGSAYQLRFEDSIFDLVTSNGVFHELSEPEKALNEMKRVLKLGSFVVISDFCNTVVGRRIGMAHRKEDHGPFSADELVNLLQNAGFVNIKVEKIRHWVLATGQK